MSTTPISDHALAVDLPRFWFDFMEDVRDLGVDCKQAKQYLDDLMAKLNRSKPIYGDTSFTRQPSEIIGELMAEQIDTAGWAFVGWVNADQELRQELLEIAVEGFLLWTRLASLQESLSD